MATQIEPTDEQVEALEEAIWDAQYEAILAEYGKHDADNANYGWGTWDTGTGLSISTKVYGQGVLQTTGTYADPTSLQHRWS